MADEEGVPPSPPGDADGITPLLGTLRRQYDDVRDALGAAFAQEFDEELRAARRKSIRSLQERLDSNTDGVRLWRSPKLVGVDSFVASTTICPDRSSYWSEEGIQVVRSGGAAPRGTRTYFRVCI
eukprot:COSAG02_NODE_41746_length_391_cov_1.054795_1_plen_124_part_10